MKDIKEKTFNFRGYIVSFSHVSHEGNVYIYLSWMTKANSHHRFAGHHCCRVLSREDLARKLQNLRKLINFKWRKHQEKLQAKRAAKSTFVNPFKIGQILHTSWGYDQTNIEYYQVTKTGKMSISIRPISQSCKEDSFMSGNAIPHKDSFIGQETTQIIQVYENGHAYVSDPSGHGLYEVSTDEIKKGIRCSWYA